MTRLARIRRDSLPETARYRDEGCELWPQCLTCPFPDCRYGDGRKVWPSTLARRRRDQEAVWLAGEGVSIRQLARQFELSMRTVWRVLQKARV